MTFARNLNAAIQELTADDIVYGGEIYPLYRSRIEELAAEYGFPVVAAIGAFAALSPNSTITGNFRSLVSCMHGIRGGFLPGKIVVSTYNRGRNSALRMLRGEVDFADICSGPKITAFRDNLLFPKTSERATIDGHMIAIMTGCNDMTMTEALFKMRSMQPGSTEKAYKRFEKTFVRWARRRSTGAPPCVLQAALWHHRRRMQTGRLGLRDDILPARGIKPYIAKEETAQ